MENKFFVMDNDADAVMPIVAYIQNIEALMSKLQNFRAIIKENPQIRGVVVDIPEEIILLSEEASDAYISGESEEIQEGYYYAKKLTIEPHSILIEAMCQSDVSHFIWISDNELLN